MNLDKEGSGVPQEVETGESLRHNEGETEQNVGLSTSPTKNEPKKSSSLINLSGSFEDIEQSSETSTSSSDSDYQSPDSTEEIKKVDAPVVPPISTHSVLVSLSTDPSLSSTNTSTPIVHTVETEVFYETPITPTVVLELKDTSSEPSSAPDSPHLTLMPSSEHSLPLTSTSEADATLKHDANPMPETLSISSLASDSRADTPSPSLHTATSSLAVTEPESVSSISTDESQISSSTDEPSPATETTPKVVIETCDTPPVDTVHSTPISDAPDMRDQEAAKPILEATTSAPETATALDLTLTVPASTPSSDSPSVQSNSTSTSADIPTSVASTESLSPEEQRKSGNVAQSSSAPDLRSSSIDRSAANPTDKPAVRLPGAITLGQPISPKYYFSPLFDRNCCPFYVRKPISICATNCRLSSLTHALTLFFPVSPRSLYQLQLYLLAVS